ncbi:acetyl-CoA carboxylase biotin carboxylase subunit [Antarcticimicrobium sediminis]|uniref:Acetyl/propionyl/methylcrotonyl-CoA carboxylase subunit alpha n=1 Tax=Antarcticimicrobium sediminis TaxID=2546227 RepID=A0A4R5EYM0_9RHOB|nr:acetyl/propionyl/methylcrotonyl-CoA carboxylase subunit alpha [Antarcticimicrobium sediminis]TDE40205.1 acetyl/propionyl/methylcrotonyl-CoA carboxylase subunit alpha [Antarcticimicrobium sediminis]
MFNKILIANRGEIACRVIESARSMGVRTVAVYSDADAGAKHVQMADDSVHIGGSAPSDSYLRGDVIIEAARASGAQAIHPGYGFLSENPDFVDAVEAAGLTFIGPSAQAIRAMGLKDAAKKLMEEAGVPVVPGYHGDNQDPEHLAGAADTIGYPVLIKAVAGGGGKGMRKVARPEEFAAALDSARSEARTAFGNDAVLIEKLVETPRHIEVQVFGDGEDAVHLFERDCSLQRRHQKVIEEAPAPGMTAQMRAAMGEAAVRAAKAIGYKGAGTIEFIVDASDGLRPDRFWFMEMNTRLQVEHPVSEAITGIDLVQWQLRVAAGEPLPLTQDEITLTGHAFEARLYAEDVPKGFLPATGKLTHLEFPAQARIDSGVRAGDVISPFYDPMIAKVITHGPTRAIALARLTRALEDCEVAGSVTNLAFLGALTRHVGFAAGNVDTGLIERDLEDLIRAEAPTPQLLAQAGLAAAGLMEGGALSGFTLWSPLARSVTLRLGEEELTCVIHMQAPDRAMIEVDGEQVVALRGAEGWRFDVALAVPMAQSGAEITLFDGPGHVFSVIDPLDREAEGAAAGNLIQAPMPGLVKAVFVAAGDQVEAGRKLAVLEAMKMEHTLIAARDGVVAEVLAVAGAQVEAGAPLVRLEEEEE